MSLGATYATLGRAGEAIRSFEQAAATFEQIGNQVGRAQALEGLAWVFDTLGRPEDATRWRQRASSGSSGAPVDPPSSIREPVRASPSCVRAPVRRSPAPSASCLLPTSAVSQLCSHAPPEGRAILHARCGEIGRRTEQARWSAEGVCAAACDSRSRASSAR
ncbi:tetratricopeptide repeat protein [Sorangium sp. So ce136]|uniref:tetratricopeptide repeat protein n=1 Tax=Sorangium sp. So ce136 TaxID=3133284 RepID=UPI003F524CA5